LAGFASTIFQRRDAAFPQIEVTFATAADGVLSVSAKNLGTGTEQTVILSKSKDRRSSCLADAEDPSP
jgi:molecular chaperone DnaK (HSP70)